MQRLKDFSMNPEKDQTSAACPYFTARMHSCGLSSNGIYLPPRVHVLTYCLSSAFKECSIYTKFIPMETRKTDSAADRRSNRRRLGRIPKKQKVLIRTCSPEGIVVGDFAEMALTLDYNHKGMRIAVNREIPSESLLLFDFDTDFLVPRLQGLAQLRWYRRTENSPENIEAGLVFKDRYSQKALALAMEDRPA